MIDPFLAKLEEWVDRSDGKIRSDVAFKKLQALGFEGSDRTVRREMKGVKENFRRGRRRVYRPWIPEPGMWAQWDWGTGPTVAGRPTQLFCAWLAWARKRVVIPTWDKALPTLISCLDQAMRRFGGAPTYWLTDNERTVQPCPLDRFHGAWCSNRRSSCRAAGSATSSIRRAARR